MEFDSTRVLVTGGTRGIGRAIVEAFATRGARVAFTYRSSGELAAKLSRELGILGFQGDAADFDSASQIVKAVVSQFGGLDVLVNNAGITRDRLLLRMSERDWDDVISANLKSCFNYAKAACRPMMR